MDRHWDENTKVFVWQVQFPQEANFLLKIIYPSLQSNTKMTTLSTLCNYGKTRVLDGGYSFYICRPGIEKGNRRLRLFKFQ